jgi:hypothetical protein
MRKRRGLISGTIGAGMVTGSVAQLSKIGAFTQTISNINELRNLVIPVDDYYLVRLSGYHYAGDGGGKMMLWDPWCQFLENGGTVISSLHHQVGQWRQLHQGVLDFRQFGIFNADQPADSALAAMVNDPDVYLIRASTELNFTQRHCFGRSGITLDFGNHRVTASGIDEPGCDLTSRGGFMHFTGRIIGDVVIVPLNETVHAQGDVLPVGSRYDFIIGGWCWLEAKENAGQSECLIQRLVQVTEYIDDGRIRVNYKTERPLSTGNSLHWTPVSPVQNVTIMNLQLIGQNGNEERQLHPLTLEFAVNCNVQAIPG